MNLQALQVALPDLLKGLSVTIYATAIGMTIAAIVGLIVACCRALRVPVFGRIGDAYVFFFRNTPLLVQLFFLFYVLPTYGLLLDPVLIGVTALGTYYGAYAAEAYRGGFASVPREQWEAAASMRFSTWQTLRFIILPQAIRPAVPVLGNYLISMFKESALLSTISVYELFGQARLAASISFQYTTIFTAVGLFYLAVSYPSSVAVRRLERRLRWT
jgi:polar amino acid transport system permease protein